MRELDAGLGREVGDQLGGRVHRVVGDALHAAGHGPVARREHLAAAGVEHRDDRPARCGGAGTRRGRGSGMPTTGMRSACAITLAGGDADAQPGEQTRDRCRPRSRRGGRASTSTLTAQVVDGGRELLRVAAAAGEPHLAQHRAAVAERHRHLARSTCRSRARAPQYPDDRGDQRVAAPGPRDARGLEPTPTAVVIAVTGREVHVEPVGGEQPRSTRSPHSTTVTASLAHEVVEPEVVQLLQVVEAVDVDVHERRGRVVLAHDGERRAHHRLGDAERDRDALGEHGLAGAELAVEHDDVAGAQHRADAAAERVRLVGGRASSPQRLIGCASPAPARA